MTETTPNELMRTFLENSLKRRLSSPMEAAEPLDSRGSALLEHAILEDLLKDYELYSDGRGHPLMAKGLRELSKVFEEFHRRAESFKAEAVKRGLPVDTSENALPAPDFRLLLEYLSNSEVSFSDLMRADTYLLMGDLSDEELADFLSSPEIVKACDSFIKIKDGYLDRGNFHSIDVDELEELLGHLETLTKFLRKEARLGEFRELLIAIESLFGSSDGRVFGFDEEIEMALEMFSVPTTYIDNRRLSLLRYFYNLIGRLEQEILHLSETISEGKSMGASKIEYSNPYTVFDLERIKVFLEAIKAKLELRGKA